jgi:hypothetical protein
VRRSTSTEATRCMFDWLARAAIEFASDRGKVGRKPCWAALSAALGLDGPRVWIRSKDVREAIWARLLQ